MKVRTGSCVFVAVIVMGLAGCRQPLHFTTLQVGRALNVDHTIAVHTTRFKPDNTIYASVLTDRTGASTIRARWSYAGRVIIETQREVSYKGPGATEFHFESAGGFPEGDYKVEIFVDGQPVASRDFRVER